MKIALCSDMHEEFWRKHGEFLRQRPVMPAVSLLHEKVDVLVAAGDIDVGAGAPAMLRNRYGDMAERIVYVPGNHEFYGGDINVVTDAIRQQCEEWDVVLLEPGITLDVYDTFFVGGTMWTDFEIDGTPYQSMREAQRHMNDFRYIRNGLHRLTPEDTVEAHEATVDNIKRALAMAHGLDMKTVVVTHHAPHSRSISERFQGDSLNPAYVSAVLANMEVTPDLWLHGHVHHETDYTANGTRVVTNPRGYPTELFHAADHYKLKVIEL